MSTSSPNISSCTDCGACCACYRVDFSVHELLSHGGAVPDGLTESVNAAICRMRGTDHASARCAALVGRVGSKCSCAIYPWRPGPCQELEAGSNACERARQRHGLGPFKG